MKKYRTPVIAALIGILTLGFAGSALAHHDGYYGRPGYAWGHRDGYYGPPGYAWGHYRHYRHFRDEGFYAPPPVVVAPPVIVPQPAYYPAPYPYYPLRSSPSLVIGVDIPPLVIPLR